MTRARDLGPDWTTDCELGDIRPIRTENSRPTGITNWGPSLAGEVKAEMLWTHRGYRGYRLRT